MTNGSFKNEKTESKDSGKKPIEKYMKKIVKKQLEGWVV